MKKAKKLLSLMLCLAMAASLFIAIPITASASGEIVLKTYVENLTTGEKTLYEQYTREDLGVIADFPDPYYAYLFFQGDNTRAVAVTEIVTLDALFGDLWAPGATLSVVAEDGFVSPFNYSFENIAEFNGYYSDPDDPGSFSEVPAGIAVIWDGSQGGESIDPDREANIAAIAESAFYSGNLRFVCGIAEPTAGAGNRLVTNVAEVTLSYYGDGPAINVLTASPEALAEKLHQLGLFRGIGDDADGNPIFDLESPINRLGSFVVTLRLRGLEAEALAYTGENPFTDVTDWGVPYAAYARSIGLTQGTSATTFDPDGDITMSNFTIILLRTLGYTDGVDFDFDAATAFAVTAGLYSGDMLAKLADGDFLRAGVVVAMTNALLARLNGSDTLLIDKLAADGVVSPFAAEMFKNTVIR